MIVSAHQPHFLPWLGYFNKVLLSDVFVWLEDVQFRKNYFQNRTKIKGNQNELWLTLPVKKGGLDQKIKDVELIKGRDFNKLSKTIKTYYSKSKYYSLYAKEIEEILITSNNSLNDLNFNLFSFFVQKLNFDTKIIKSESLKLIEQEPNKRLIEICSKLNATKYIAGKGSRDYMNQSLFESNNIDILWQKYPVEDVIYQQLKGNFISGLSILDVIFNVGEEKTRELIEVQWKN